MIAAFRNHLPVKIRFGDGVAGQLASVLEEEGATRPFLVMDRGQVIYASDRASLDEAALKRAMAI